MRYYFILLFIMVSCKETRQQNKDNLKIKIETKKNTITDNKAQKTINSIKKDVIIKKIDTSNIHCNIEAVKLLDENMNNPTEQEITFFLLTFNKLCKNNIEYSEYSNEILFRVINKYPVKVIKLINKNLKIDKKLLLFELSEPINEEIDCKILKQKMLNINDSFAKKIATVLPEN